jgi:hypothetical protein
MNDPLNLTTTPPPENIRAQRAAPHPFITQLNTRIASNYFADSLETKVVLLSHLIYHIYRDLKEYQTK